MILFYAPLVPFASAGVRIVYRQVEILNRHGIKSAVLHVERGKTTPDMPKVPTRFVTDGNFHADDIFVVPEGEPVLMAQLQNVVRRRIVIALNWDYLYESLPNGQSLQTFGIERVITHSHQIAEMIAWSARLPTHVFVWSINPKLYFFDPTEKEAAIVFIKRKQQKMAALMRLLWARNRQFVERIRWAGLDGLSEERYAEFVRRARVFINLSNAEGLPCSLLEAMRAGTIVAGYNSVGGRDQLIGEGAKQNCILAENLDYVTLAQKLEPLLLDMLQNDTSRWDVLRQNAFDTAGPFTPQAEEESIIEMWRQILAQ